FLVSGFPSPAVAGTPGTFTVQARDSFNNFVTGYTGTVLFSTNDLQGSFAPTSYTFTAADNGVHVFTNGATLATAGSQKIVATDSANTTITGSQTVKVTATNAVAMSLTGLAATTTAGSNATATVTLLDTFGNVATGYRGTVTFASSDTQAALPMDY